MKVISGVAVSPGLVVAPIRRIYRIPPDLNRIIEEPYKERVRLETAIALAREELAHLEAQAADQTSKDIFFFQSCLLEDDGLLSDLNAAVESGCGAACAMERVGRKNADRLLSLQDNPYMQLRATDVLDTCQRVVDILDGHPQKPILFEHPVILASEQMLPSDMVSAPAGVLRGVVTVSGSPQSHAAIIARSLGIPAVAQLGAEFLEECDGHIAILDGTAGTLTLDPTLAARQHALQRIMTAQEDAGHLQGIRSRPCRTTDGHPFTILANCFGPDDIRAAMEAGAAGVGLVRSEYLLIQRSTPDEEEQYQFYASCLAAANGRPVCVRTFDIGADATTRTLGESNLNGELGLRGIRYCLAHPALFETQLCALLRAGLCGPLSVNIPMVSCPEDWQLTMECVQRAKAILRRRGVPFKEDLPFGLTMETPSACLEADAYPPMGCRFFMMGLNDLVQYTHAADRNSSLLAPYYKSTSPAVQKLIALCIDAARRADIPISVNGLVLETPTVALGCLRQGIHTFSLAPQHILNIKKYLTEAAYAAPHTDGTSCASKQGEA